MNNISKRDREILLNNMISSDYESESKRYKNIMQEFNDKFYKQYKSFFPLRKTSQKYIKEEIEKIIKIDLLPEKKEYIEICKKNEFFDITIALIFRSWFRKLVWYFPYPINVHKVTKYINEHHIEAVELELSKLKKIINPECFDEFDMHIQAKKQGMDFLDIMKKDNPVIVLCEGNIVNQTYLINGTHRAIQAIRKGESKIKGYVISTDVCKTCGMTKGFEAFYEEMLNIYRNAYGIREM